MHLRARTLVCFFALCLGLVVSTTAEAQVSTPELVHVYFTGGVARTPSLEVVIESPAVQASLAEVGLQASDFSVAFPRFVEADTLATRGDGRPVKRMNLAKVFEVRVPSGRPLDQFLNQLRSLPVVLFAEPKPQAVPDATPNDSHYLLQWAHISGTGAQTPAAWDVTTGNPTSIIAIIDGGVDGTHPDLGGKVSGDGGWGWGGHGIHVAGIAGANTDNTEGIAGVNWAASLHSQRVDGRDPTEAVFDAIGYSTDVVVLNNSWTLTDGFSVSVRSAFAYGYTMNRTAVAAMGNDGAQVTRYPAGFGQGIIAVGATNSSGDRWSGSNYGNHIDVTAPGVHILSTYRNSGWVDENYEYLTGTSMATPHVAGVASLLKGFDSTLDNDDIEQIIRLSATDAGATGWDMYYGAGRLDANKAISYLQQPYVLDHYLGYSGTDMGSTGSYSMTFIGTDGLADAIYIVKRHEVQVPVSFAARDSLNIWTRGVASTGFARTEPDQINYGMGYAEIVPGSVTQTTATLRTYVYEVWNTRGQWVGWFPSTPSGAVGAFTTLGIDNTPPPPPQLPTAPTGLSGWWYPEGHGGPKTRLEWDRNPGTEGVDYYWVEYSLEDGPFTLANKSVYDPGSGQTVTWDHWLYYPQGAEYLRYRVKAHNSVGWGSFCEPIEVPLLIGPLSLEEASAVEAMPEELILDSNYPNPFNPSTQIRFGLPQASQVRLQVLNLRGQQVRLLVDHQLPAGWHTVTWDGKNASGVDVASGIYLYIVEVEGKRLLKKMTLIR